MAIHSLKVGQKIKVERQCVYSENSRAPSEVETIKTVTAVRKVEVAHSGFYKTFVTFRGVKGELKVSTCSDGSHRTFTRYLGYPLKYFEIL